MSNQAENKPEAKDGHKLQGKYHLNFRLDPEDFAVIEQHQKEFGFKNCVSAIRDILQKVRLHGLQLEEEIIDFQTCEFYSGVISHPEWTRCYQHHHGHNIPTKQCIVCHLHKTLKIPIMTIPRLEARFKDRQAQYHDLFTLIEKLKIEALQLDKTTERGYQNTIEGIQKNWKLTQETLRNTTKERDWLRIAKSPIEFDEKLHSDPLSHTQREIQKPSVGTYMVEEVTEKEKVTKKFVQQQPQESKTPSQLIICPDTKEFVNVEDVCKKTCKKFLDCPDYEQIVVQKAKAVPRQ